MHGVCSRDSTLNAASLRKSSCKERFYLFWPSVSSSAPVPHTFGAVREQCERTASAALAAGSAAHSAAQPADAFTNIARRRWCPDSVGDILAGQGVIPPNTSGS